MSGAGLKVGGKMQSTFLIGGVILWAATIGAGLLDPHAFMKAYLTGYMLWLGFPLGAIGILCLHYLVGGGWSFLIRRFIEAAASTVPLMFLLLLPFLVGVADLYLWADSSIVAQDAVLQHKSAYLNVDFFRIRAVGYFIVWALLGHFLVKWSTQQDQSGDVRLTSKLQALAGPGLVLYILTMTFATIDWVMSLDPHWFSTIHGLVFVMGQGVSALALSILCIVKFGHIEALGRFYNERYLRDLGTLMFAFVMLWAYMCFSQYLIIWSGNLPEETPFYIVRGKGVWGWLGLAILLFHFALPFSLLLSREVKRQTKTMTAIAGLVIVMRLVDLFWYIGPAGAHGEHALDVPFHLSWIDIAAPLGIGGIWISMFLRHLGSHNLMPLRDPLLEEAFKVEH
jgi:hypothetical protein